jgi:glycosyltransferase involved in cell wall biosynthesis
MTTVFPDTEWDGSSSRRKPDMKPLVLIYTAILSSTGGGQNAMSLLTQELVERGYDLAFLTRPPLRSRHRYVQLLKRHRVPILVLPRFSDFWIVKVGRVLSSLLLALPYAALRRRKLAFSWKAAASIFLTRVARFERRYIRNQLASCAENNRDVILHVWGPAALTPLLLEWADETGVPAIYHEMGEADEQYVETWQLEPTVEAIHRAQEVICCSQSVSEMVRRVYGYGGRIATIPFMIQDPGEGWRRARNNAGRITLGAIGRLVPHKRHGDLLHALKRLSDEGYDAGLVIAGNGPLRGSLEELSIQLGIHDRVTFTGEFDRLEDVMAQFDIFVLTSSSESQCMPITESMAYGKPVVASNFGGIPDFVEDGVTGFLVPFGDEAKLVKALKTLIDNPSLREEMGRRGRERYVEHYTPSKVADAMEEVYDSVLTAVRASELKEVSCNGRFASDQIGTKSV